MARLIYFLQIEWYPRNMPENYFWYNRICKVDGFRFVLCVFRTRTSTGVPPPLVRPGHGYPLRWWDLDRGTPSPSPLDRGTPPPPREHDTPGTGYAAGGTLLAVMPEDFVSKAFRSIYLHAGENNTESKTCNKIYSVPKYYPSRFCRTLIVII